MVPEPQPPQKSSGCFPFVMGCLSGCFFMLMIIVGLAAGAIYLGGHFVNKYAVSLYYKELRPEIEESQLTQNQKQVLLKDLDQLARDFPQMSLSEKKEAIGHLVETMQKLKDDPRLPEQTPHDDSPSEP